MASTEGGVNIEEVAENNPEKIFREEIDPIYGAQDEQSMNLSSSLGLDDNQSMQFREIFRDRPCITIPDDHDIGQGNLWGENGKIASSPAGNDGGYFYDKDYVKMVERAQTNHLPDPYDNTLICLLYTSDAADEG